MKIEWIIKENAVPQGSSDGFWYDLTDGGGFDLSEVLSDQSQIDDVKKAVAILRSLENTLEAAGLINEF